LTPCLPIIRARLRERDIGERDISETDIGVRDIGERDIGERDIGERDIGERDIGETVATCRFNLQLLIHIQIHIHIGSVSGGLRFSQSGHRQAKFLERQKLQMLQPTERISVRRSWLWARLRGLWLWGRRWRL
jgi:hypothetical protein